MKVAQRRGMRRAIVSIARRLAVVPHRMWTDGTGFGWGSEPPTAVAADWYDLRAFTVLPRQEEGPHGDEGGVRS